MGPTGSAPLGGFVGEGATIVGATVATRVAVGAMEGDATGAVEGSSDGVTVGFLVGVCVGVADGDCDGAKLELGAGVLSKSGMRQTFSEPSTSTS